MCIRDSHGLAAGCHAVLSLPAEVDEDAVVDAARSLSVRVSGLGRYRLTPSPGNPGLLLSFGNLTENQLVRGVHAIAEAVRQAEAAGPTHAASVPTAS